MSKRVITYSILLGILTILTGIGLFNIITKPNYRNNEVSFKVNNDQAFFEVNASYFYGETSEPTKTYSAQYVQEDYYNGKVATVESWEIGASQFINDDEHPENNKDSLTYIINITNRNAERNLNIKVNNVAVQKDGYFITEISYKNSGNAEQATKIFSNDPEAPVNVNLYYHYGINPNTVSINSDEVVGSNNTLQIIISLKLNTRTKAFTVANNFSIELESIEK